MYEIFGGWELFTCFVRNRMGKVWVQSMVCINLVITFNKIEQKSNLIRLVGKIMIE